MLGAARCSTPRHKKEDQRSLSRLFAIFQDSKLAHWMSVCDRRDAAEEQALSLSLSYDSLSRESVFWTRRFEPSTAHLWRIGFEIGKLKGDIYIC